MLLLEQACAVLHILSTHTDGDNRKLCEERKALIGQAGGVKAVTKTMRTHASYAELLEYAFGALFYLCIFDNDNRRRVVQAGGINILVNIMKRHATAPKIQDEATKALLNLTSTRDIKRKVAEIATEAVEEAKRRFPQLKYPPLLLKHLSKRKLWRAI